MILRLLLIIVPQNHPIHRINRKPHHLVLETETEIDGPGNTMTTLTRTKEEGDIDPVRFTL
jgi:hypothetical protein